jgi:hypothetical protein
MDFPQHGEVFYFYDQALSNNTSSQKSIGNGIFLYSSKFKFLFCCCKIGITVFHFGAPRRRAAAEFVCLFFSYILSSVYCEFHNGQKQRTKSFS